MKFMQDKRKTLILFDAGAVLVKLDYGSFFREASKIRGCSSEEFAKLYNESGIETDSLSGKLSDEETLEKTSKLISPYKPISIEETVNLIKLNWPEEISDVVNLKRRVFDAGYSIGLFSNISNFALDTISNQWSEIFETYDASMPKIYSFQVGSVKPQVEMYQKIKGYDRVIFIDDKESYLRTGIEKFGWIGVHFTPYIDNAESIRSHNNHSDKTKPENNFYTVDSIKALEKCLITLSVKI